MGLGRLQFGSDTEGMHQDEQQFDPFAFAPDAAAARQAAARVVRTLLGAALDGGGQGRQGIGD